MKFNEDRSYFVSIDEIYEMKCLELNKLYLFSLDIKNPKLFLK